jgi:hypothetical protein
MEQAVTVLRRNRGLQIVKSKYLRKQWRDKMSHVREVGKLAGERHLFNSHITIKYDKK